MSSVADSRKETVSILSEKEMLQNIHVNASNEVNKTADDTFEESSLPQTIQEYDTVLESALRKFDLAIRAYTMEIGIGPWGSQNPKEVDKLAYRFMDKAVLLVRKRMTDLKKEWADDASS